MKKFLLIVFALLAMNNVFPQTYEGTIIRVIDGDTYAFQTEDGAFVVRMLGIDAPEKGQPYSQAATNFISGYMGRNVVTKVSGTDRYGRRLGVLFDGGKDINLLSLNSGFSWHYKETNNDQVYADAEKYARKNRIGLWDLPDPVAPWKWRKRVR